MARGRKRAGAGSSNIRIENFIIKSDEKNWSLFKVVPSEKNGEAEIEMGHYPTLPSLINSMKEFHLRDTEATTLKELKEALDDFREAVEEAWA